MRRPIVLLTVLALSGTRIAWPVASHRDAYFTAGAAPLAVYLVLWGLLVNFVSSGDPAPTNPAMIPEYDGRTERRPCPPRA